MVEIVDVVYDLAVQQPEAIAAVTRQFLAAALAQKTPMAAPRPDL